MTDDQHTVITAGLWWLIVLLLISLMCSGCMQSERASTGAAHSKTQTREIPTADGGKLIMQESWTETDEQSTTKTGFDPAITTALSTGLAAVGKAATGDWSGAIESVLAGGSILAATYAANQRAKATSANQRADEHKADAAEGWANFKEAASAPRTVA